MKKTTTFLFLIPVLFVFFGSSAQNKIDKSKKELNSSSSSSSKSSSSSSNSSSSSDDGEDLGLVAEIVVNVVFGVFKYGFIGDYTNEEHLYTNLTPYPFYNEKSGNYENVDQDTVSKNRMRFDIEDNFIYSDNNLFGNHLKAKVRPFQYFYLQADYHQLFEFNKFNNTSDQLALFHFNLCYDRIRFEKFNFGWNVGASYVGSGVNKTGFSYGLSADYFMTKHLSFSGSAKWSQINSQPIKAFEIKTKYYKKNHFFSLGFERLQIASPKYNFIAIGGGIHF